LGKDELLNDLSEIKKKKGFAIYVKNTVPKREIKNLYINENNLTQYKAKKIYKELQEDTSTLYVDSFEKIMHLNEDRMKRTLWFGPIQDSYATTFRHRILDLLQQNQTGMVKSIRVKRGKKIRGKTNTNSVYMFVEYEHEDSVNKAIRLIGKGRMSFSRKAYLCGT
jgi:hypothetical protein